MARGLSDAKDRMIRIGHFGILTVDRLRQAMGSVESVMADMGLAKRKSVQVAEKK